MNPIPTHIKSITKGKISFQGKPDISIIILNYNAKDVLFDCLKSIEIQQGLKIQVIVVDNISTDDSVSMLKKEFKNIDLVERDTPKGFSAGNNAGVPQAKSDMILFLNPDMKLENKDDLKKCLDFYQSQENIGIMTCRVNLAISGKIDQTCHRGFPTPWAALTHFSGLSKVFPKSKLFSQYSASYLDYDTPHPIDSGGGMFMLLNRSIGDQIGWWSEDYDLMGEDIDFFYRVNQLGLVNWYWPEVKVLHYKGYSTGKSKQSQKVSKASIETKKRVKGWSVDAMEVFYKHHYQQKYPFFINWLVYLGIKIIRLIRVGI
jgi:GT2 family glycosyltransferase